MNIISISFNITGDLADTFISIPKNVTSIPLNTTLGPTHVFGSTSPIYQLIIMLKPTADLS